MRLCHIGFEWKREDLWVGAYWRWRGDWLDVWICLLPCVPLHVVLQCGEECHWCRHFGSVRRHPAGLLVCEICWETVRARDGLGGYHQELREERGEED